MAPSATFGHASVSITIDVYGHIMPKATAETAAKLGEARAAALSSVAG